MADDDPKPYKTLKVTDLAGNPLPGSEEPIYLDLEAMREADRRRQDDLLARGLPALKRLVEVAQGYSGQSHHCRRILLAVYNGLEWPLDLTRLRRLDEDLQAAALTVIEWASYTQRELHNYLDDGNRIMLRFWERERPAGDDDEEVVR